jgi:hypothetical protein
MASNIDITLKRYNGTDYDLILPTTHLGQIYTDNTLATSLATFLTNTYINVNQIGAANGLATLDANQKITASQLPDYVVGGMRFIGSINDLAPYNNLNTNPALSNMSTVKPGSYFIVVGSYADIQFTPATYDPITEEETADGHIIINPGDEGDVTSPVRLESGDWLVYLGYDNASIPGDDVFQLSRPSGVEYLAYQYSHKWAIVNNSYQNATTTEHGIVQLSGATDTTGITNKVITEAVLGNLIGTTANTIAAGDHLHDDRYYTETEIQSFFSGATAITGYSKTNWDTAYGWGNHADEGYLTDESLADLTDITLTNAATNDILRYNGTNWVNDATFKPILYGASFATGDNQATITGTLCIETT